MSEGKEEEVARKTAYMREYRAKNAEKMKAYDRVRSASKKKKDSERQYRIKNPDTIKAINQRCAEKRRQDPVRELEFRWKTHLHGCRGKDRINELSQDDHASLVSSSCWYCNDQGSPYIGIDRVDSEFGYIQGNVVPCCHSCNKMKMDMPQADFIEQVRKIAENVLMMK